MVTQTRTVTVATAHPTRSPWRTIHCLTRTMWSNRLPRSLRRRLPCRLVPLPLCPRKCFPLHWVRMRVYLRVFIYVCVKIYVYMYVVCMPVYVCMYVCVYVCMYACIHVCMLCVRECVRVRSSARRFASHPPSSVSVCVCIDPTYPLFSPESL